MYYSILKYRLWRAHSWSHKSFCVILVSRILIWLPRFASCSSQIYPLDPAATPCLLWLPEQAGFWKFSSRTISSCSIPSQRAHDHRLAVIFIFLSPPLLFLSLPLSKTQKSALTSLPQFLPPSSPFPEWLILFTK